MAKHKAFPSTLFVKRENEGSTEEYITTAETIEELAEVGETPLIAEYKLVRASKVRVAVTWPTTSKPVKGGAVQAYFERWIRDEKAEHRE